MARSDAAIFHLNKEGHEVILASKEKAWPFTEYSNFKYVCLPDVNVRTRFYGDEIKTQVWHGEDKNLAPYREHLKVFFALLDKENPDVVVVDSTPEVMLMVKLLGFKTVYVYETMEMKPNELRFDLAWKNADKIVFPYPEYFAEELGFSYPQAEYCSGYTRIENLGAKIDSREKDNILIAFGKGEKTEHVLDTIMTEVLKKYKNVSMLSGGIDVEKYSKYPIKFVATDQGSVVEALEKSDIYICGAGYNTIMEALYLRKRIVAIPLERPYNEQIIKAEIFARHKALRMILPEDAERILSEIDEVLKIPQETIDKAHAEGVSGQGSKKAAKVILGVAKEKE